MQDNFTLIKQHALKVNISDLNLAAYGR